MCPPRLESLWTMTSCATEDAVTLSGVVTNNAIFKMNNLMVKFWYFKVKSTLIQTDHK